MSICFDDHTKIFTEKYETCEWGDNQNSNYNGSSGNGSQCSFNADYIAFMKKFIRNNNIKTVADLGCGDWQSSHLIYKNSHVQYFGYDAYDKIIKHNSKKYPQFTFSQLDILNNVDSIKSGCDLYVIKDVLQHWTCKEIKHFMDQLLQKKYKYIIVVNSCKQEFDNQDEPFRSRPLSIKYEPLKSYNLKYLFNYQDKEVSLLSLV